MALPVYIFDPTIQDEASKVRGIGRYMQTYYDAFGDEFHFTADIKSVPYESIFIYPFFNFLQFPFSLQRIAKKQVTVIHDLIPFKYPEHFPYGLKGLLSVIFNKASLKNFDAIITDSLTSKKDIVEMLNYNKQDVTVIYPTVPEVFEESYKKPPVKNTSEEVQQSLPKVPYIVYVGDVTWNKNLINLAKAIKIADVHCVFVGKHFLKSKMNITLINKKKAPNPWLDELYGFYEESNGDDRFHMYGFVSDHFLLDLYRNAVSNILVSRDEGFGYSFLEAGITNTPSILADTPIFHETAGESALFAKPEDPLDIADKIKKMTEPSVKKALQKLLPERVETFSRNAFKKNVRKLVESLQTRA